MTRVIRQNISWELDPEFAPLLDAVLGAPGRIVKESRAKLVTEHQAGERRYFVKRYRHAAVPFRPLKFFFKPSQAHQEWSLAEAVSARGIPIVRHVALGQRWTVTGLQESVLITEGFDGAPANEVAGIDPDALVAFVQRMAEAGVIQEDLHPANLLVRTNPFEIRLVDLHGARVVEAGSAHEHQEGADRMLATLSISFPIKVPPSVALLARSIRKKALHQRARRCLKTNRDFSVERAGGRRWHVRTAAAPRAVRAMSDPDRFLREAAPFKQGRSSTVGRADGIVLKRYNFKKPLNAAKDLFRGSRARRSFVKGYHLELCGIATARVIAAASERVLGMPTRSFLVMEEVPGAVDCVRWTGEARVLAQRLGRLIARMHDEGFIHRDLKETNLLLDGEGVPHLIDLDGLKFVSNVSPEDAASNLIRLARGIESHGRLSRAAVVEFLLSYCRFRQVRPRQLFPRRHAAV